MLLLLTLALQSAQEGSDAVAFDLSRSSSSIDGTNLSRCGNTALSDDIVVCGEGRDRYRLPLPNERDPSDRIRNEAPNGLVALTLASRCGIFAGERRCNNREAAQYGYGNGRNPIKVIARLAGQVADPDGN